LKQFESIIFFVVKNQLWIVSNQFNKSIQIDSNY
jgi:hypothetical protein